MIPTQQMRINQYKGNKRTMDLLAGLEDQPSDWVVTAAFYCALHLVERKLRVPKKRKHEERNRLVIADAELGIAIADAYKALFNESVAARYDCIPISRKRAHEAIGYLGIIEGEIN